jgi:tRNA 2-thiouridine synthesizing protein A
MSVEHDSAETLDVQGENCPMPVVKTKQAVDDRATDEVLEVLATDPGSMSDIKGWADSTAGVELVDQIEAERDGEELYKHYVRKTE